MDILAVTAAFTALAVALFGAMRHSRCSKIETPCCTLVRDVVNVDRETNTAAPDV